VSSQGEINCTDNNNNNNNNNNKYIILIVDKKNINVMFFKTKCQVKVK